MGISTPIARRVRQQRERNGWSQSELAAQAGLSVKTIARTEAGSNRPTPATQRKLARALDVTVSDLVAFDGLAADAGSIERFVVELQHKGRLLDVRTSTHPCLLTKGSTLFLGHVDGGRWWRVTARNDLSLSRSEEITLLECEPVKRSLRPHISSQYCVVTAINHLLLDMYAAPWEEVRFGRNDYGKVRLGDRTYFTDVTSYDHVVARLKLMATLNLSSTRRQTGSILMRVSRNGGCCFRLTVGADDGHIEIVPLEETTLN